jgi:hypothetical protein
MPGAGFAPHVHHRCHATDPAAGRPGEALGDEGWVAQIAGQPGAHPGQLPILQVGGQDRPPGPDQLGDHEPTDAVGRTGHQHGVARARAAVMPLPRPSGR